MTTENHGIKKLTDYQHLRKRTEMYLGARTLHTQHTLIHTANGPIIKELSWVPALMTSFREIIDNSLDEFTKAGIAGKLEVYYDEEDLTFQVEDNGRGIPIDWASEHNCHLATLVMSHLKAGRNFDDTDRKGVAGQNGLGGSAIVNVASNFELEIVRGGKPWANPSAEDANYKGNWKFAQRFFEGNPVLDDALQICDPVITKTSAKATGTLIRYTLSKEVFKHHTLPTELVESLLREIAAANPTLLVYFNGDKLSYKNKSLFPKAKPIELNINVPGLRSNFYVIPNMLEHGAETTFLMHSLVNNIPTFDGGNHLDTFKRIFALALLKNLEGMSKKKRLKPNRSDIEEGLLIYNTTVMDAPFFQGQAKTKLINDEVIKPIEQAMNDEWFAQIIKRNKEWIDEIYARCAERTNKKDDDELAKEARKNLRKKVAKLLDANGRRGRTTIPRSQCTLFITEGDSAVGGLSDVRDPAIHGALPLRGKILNVSDDKVTPKKLLESQAIADIMNALGLIPGVKAERANLRYGKLFIATDSDVDGANIAALVNNFLYTYWPELYDADKEPFVHIFMTPYIILEKGKQRNYYFMDNVHEFKPEDWKGWNIRRAKGLGTLQKQDWNFAVNTELRSIPIIDDGLLKDTLDLLFNKTRADDRKEWMQDPYYTVGDYGTAKKPKPLNVLANHIQIAIESSRYLNESSREYALYVAENRGIPSIWDGLKDGQRKALYLLQKRAGELKTISLAGEMISSGLYVHGDAAAAEAIGKLAAPYQNNLPFIKGIGNFGTKIKPADIAAPRYTYVKRNNVTEQIMYPDSDVVPMMDNYDGSAQSPKHYLPLIPTVLLNGISGMAPGFSTDILPRSIDDVIAATIDVLNLKLPKTLDPKFEYCDGPVRNTGINKWAFYGKIAVLDSATVHISELCPFMTHEKFIERLEDMIDKKLIKDYLDNTKDKIDFTIRLERQGAMVIDAETGERRMWTDIEACHYFDLVYNTTERIVVVDWDGTTIKPYSSAAELLINFVQKRFDFYVKRYEKMREDDIRSLQYWELLKLCYDEDLPSFLKGLNNKAELVAKITEIAIKHEHYADQDQLDKIASLPTYRWAKDEYQKIVDEIAEHKECIDVYNDMLSNSENIWEVYRSEVKALKKVKFDIER